MRRRIDPTKMVLGMMARTCGECTSIQHVFFRTQDEYDTWECPECKEKVEEIEDNPEPETES